MAGSLLESIGYVNHWPCARPVPISLEVTWNQYVELFPGLERSARPERPRGPGSPPSPGPARPAPDPRVGTAAPEAPSEDGPGRSPCPSPNSRPSPPGCGLSGGDHGRSRDWPHAKQPGSVDGAPSDTPDGCRRSGASRPADSVETTPHRRHTDDDDLASDHRRPLRSREHGCQTDADLEIGLPSPLRWVSSREQRRVISR